MLKAFNYLHLLRAIAIVQVVLIHICAPVLHYDAIGTSNWWIANVFDSFSRISIPLFLMISGTLLLKVHLPYSEFIRKRWKRIIVPLFFWSLVYIGYKLSFEDFVSIEQTTRTIVVLLISGNPTSFHFWYLYMLIGCYLLIPVFSSWIQKATQKEIGIFLIIWIIALLFKHSFLYKYQISVKLEQFAGYFGFFVLGFYLDKIKNYQPYRLAAFIIAFLSFAVILCGSYYLSVHKGQYEPYFTFYLGLPVILFAISFFYLAKQYFEHFVKARKIIIWLSDYSFGIYLSHILVLMVLSIYQIDINHMKTPLGFPLLTIGTIVLSIVICWSLRQIPKIGNYLT